MLLLPKLPQPWATGVKLSPRSGLVNLRWSESITSQCNCLVSAVMIL